MKKKPGETLPGEEEDAAQQVGDLPHYQLILDLSCHGRVSLPRDLTECMEAEEVRVVERLLVV